MLTHHSTGYLVQGIPVCFDAKECAAETFALENIHPHQVEFMKTFENQDGIAFFLIYYTGLNEFYYLPFRKLYEFWERAENGGRKSFRHEELSEEFVIKSPGENGLLIPYLEALQKDLDAR